jgi:hypothetical protein
MPVQKVGHQLVSLLGFGQGGIVPEGVRQRFENNQLGIDAGAQIRAVEDGGSA